MVEESELQAQIINDNKNKIENFIKFMLYKLYKKNNIQSDEQLFRICTWLSNLMNYNEQIFILKIC